MILGKHHKIRLILYLQLVIISSVGCHVAHSPVKITANNQKIATTVDSSYSLTETFLAPYRKQLKDSFSAVIATTTERLVKERPGGSLGNLVVHALAQSTQSMLPHPQEQFYLMNYGGIRLKEIAKGNITVGKIFELLPFENTLVIIEISGKQLAELLRKINERGGWPIRYRNRELKKNRQQIISTHSLKQIAQVKKIRLYTNNYLAQGGDNCSILKTLPQEDTGILLRNIVIDYLKQKKTITPDNNNYILK